MSNIHFLQAQPGWKVSSLNQAKAFYEQLGFHSVFQNEQLHLVMAKDSVVIHLSTIEGELGGCQIIVDDVNALYQLVQLKKIHIQYDIGNRIWGNRDFTIMDPDGNTITFSQRINQDLYPSLT